MAQVASTEKEASVLLLSPFTLLTFNSNSFSLYKIHAHTHICPCLAILTGLLIVHTMIHKLFLVILGHCEIFRNICPCPESISPTHFRACRLRMPCIIPYPPLVSLTLPVSNISFPHLDLAKFTLSL